MTQVFPAIASVTVRALSSTRNKEVQNIHHVHSSVSIVVVLEFVLGRKTSLETIFCFLSIVCYLKVKIFGPDLSRPTVGVEGHII